jgi:hypothetical protein
MVGVGDFVSTFFILQSCKGHTISMLLYDQCLAAELGLGLDFALSKLGGLVLKY